MQKEFIDEKSLQTVAMSCFGIQCVTGATALESNACVRSNGIIAALRFRTIVIIYLAFVDVCNSELFIRSYYEVRTFQSNSFHALPTHAFNALSKLNPDLQLHSKAPAKLMQF